MDKKKTYYKKLDIIRVLSCVAVLFYHLGIIKGGYLAVCIFFVLSGYLSCVSLFNKEKVDIKKYYLSRLKKIYLPLVIVTFISIGFMSFFKGIIFLNLKPETTSVLFGYNNFWQLSNNTDYFARCADSPFVHFWYISILMQFDLVFPFIFMGLKKACNKFSTSITCWGIAGVTAVLSLIFFIVSKNNIMVAYYNTFIRMYALLMGVLVGFLQKYYGPLLSKKSRTSDLKFWIYVGIVILLCLFVDSGSKLFGISMIGISIITCRLIDLSFWNTNSLNDVERVIKGLGDLSYEVYLVQYPIIYIISCYVDKQFILVPLVIIFTLLTSLMIHFGLLFFSKNNVAKKAKGIVFAILVLFTLYGGIRYIIAPDNTAEINEMRQQLEDAKEEIGKNEALVKQSQEEYDALVKQEEENWHKMLQSLEVNEEELKKQVDKLQIVTIGDSVMLGAVGNMKKIWPNGYFDAEVSRGMGKALTIIDELKKQNRFGSPLVIHLGTNGGCNNANLKKIMDAAGDRDVYFLTTTYHKMLKINTTIKDFCNGYENCHIIDWYQYVEDWRKEHADDLKNKKINDLTYADGIHLRPGKGSGRESYAQLVYDSIYQTYVDKINAQKEAAIKAHEAEALNKMSFYGNELLLGSFDNLSKTYTDALFVTNKDYDYKSLKEELNNKIKDGTLTYNVVLVFDPSAKITGNQWSKIMDLLVDRKVYFVTVEKPEFENIWTYVTFIDFSGKIKKNPDYVLLDGVHLSSEGNEAFTSYIKKKLK